MESCPHPISTQGAKELKVLWEGSKCQLLSGLITNPSSGDLTLSLEGALALFESHYRMLLKEALSCFENILFLPVLPHW